MQALIEPSRAYPRAVLFDLLTALLDSWTVWNAAAGTEEKGRAWRAEYLRLNPNGTVPTLIVEGAPVYECAALLLLLAERHPETALAPSPGDAKRATFLQWMVHFANTLQPAYRQWFYPQDFAPAEHEKESKEFARRRIEAVWDRLEAHLAANGPHILGEHFGIVDLYATMLMRWSRNMPKPATSWTHVGALAQRVKARPSWKRLYDIEGLTEWA
jgi:glutathione S-transferase